MGNDDVGTSSLSHLERMGRELKCPICWSLLNSSVSLTCNHVFCNSCILKSMKSASDCPVCKVPFTRREVRPAPHMDNMVSIYKSMEDASGISMFVTQNQNASVTKLSDGEKQCQGDADCEKKNAGQTHKKQVQKKKNLRKKGPSKKNMASTKAADFAKPSFPAKKRVQVSQDPLSETPLKNYKFGVSLSEINKEGPDKDTVFSNERAHQSQKDEPVLSPFFWLREEEDGEKLTQHSNGDQFIDGSTPTLPSFSDLKDSDDGSPSKKAPLDEVQNKTSANLFDSEMFDWTQQPCSPELFSSPAKMQMQVEDTYEHGENEENFVSISQELVKKWSSADGANTNCKNPEEGNGLDDAAPQTVTSEITSYNDQNGIKKNSKRGRKPRGKAKQGRIEEQRDPVDGMDVDSNMSIKNNHKHNFSIVGNTNRRAKRVSFSTSTNPTPQTAFKVSNILVLSKGEAEMANKSNGSSCKENEKHASQKICGKSKRKRSGKQKLDYVQEQAEELSLMHNKTNEFASSASSILTPVVDNSGMAYNKRLSKHNSSKNSRSCIRDLQSNKKLKLSSDCIGKTEKDGKFQPRKNVQKSSDVKALNDTSKEKLCSLVNEPVLQKCESHVKKYQCVFCLSSDESEVSGPLVHYYDGKPVTADHEGGSKVIHSHRNCTEWAPNVYFANDIAINLEAEINRSRRIKCSLCELKGAALGCYEKSCRRSFHVTCAKLTSQCRWDMQNFVMLCPLHASSKLPCESSGSQDRGSKSTARGSKSLASRPHITSRSQPAHRSYNKIILCCSALSEQERGAVSEFERVTKVTVLKKWDSSVTHVIASTDENGACRRTLKVLLGILEGKWILNIGWINACMKEMGPVDEERYEITVDIHGIKDGPRLGRLRILNKQPKLLFGYKFYFMGDFESSYKGYLQDLVTAAGGTILHRKPVSGDEKSPSPDMHPHQTLIIYSLELPDNCSPVKKDTMLKQRRRDSETLASSTGSKVASNTWILNSIAACKLQSPIQ